MKKLNIELLRKVARAIKKHPEQFQMGSYFSALLDLPHSPDAGGCGTAACIAGWTCHIALSKKGDRLVEIEKLCGECAGHKAAELLGLNPTQRERLFLANHWPDRFAAKYYGATKSTQQAAAAAERIEHFIKHNE